MPELPEVLTISRDLKKEAVGKKIIKVSVYNDYKLTPSRKHFEDHVVGSVIEDVSNIAKLITIKLSSGKYIASHLNMTGRLLHNTKDPYVKIRLDFDNGDHLHYSSVRMFGYFQVWDKEKLDDYKKGYAKTAIDESLTLNEFITALKKKNTLIKQNLLDQKLVSGIGNIYANDALYMSKINPKRKTHTISEKEYKVLFENVQKILNEGIEHRGSTIDRYADLYGKPGWHQKHFRVYGKKNTNCKECNTPITFEKVQGRGTFYCSKCQPENTQAALF